MKKKIIFGLICLLAFTTSVSAEDYSELFNEIAPNGVLELSSIKPTTQTELNEFLTVNLSWDYDPIQISAYVENCNQELTQCDLHLTNMGGQDTPVSQENHVVQITYKETDQEMKKLVDKYVTELENSKQSDGHILLYDVADLSLINYYYHIENKETNSDLNDCINYSIDLKEMFGNTNINYYLNNNAGSGSPMQDMGFFGTFALVYDGYIYGAVDYLGVQQKPVIYVPDDTIDTDEAYVAAAKKRIEDYLGKDAVKFEVWQARTILEDEGYDFEKLAGTTNLSENIYNLTIGDITRPFIIAKDSSKITNPEYVNKDLKTNVEISSNSSEVPLDTNISVSILNTDSEEFKKINEVLNVELSQSYDLTLYSNTANSNISKLTNGNLFEVSVPISESLKGKELIAYYVNANNEKEEHVVTIVDGIAKFTTNHFSIYTIAERKTSDSVQPGTIPEDPIDEQIPPTFDGIMNYVVIGVIGLVGLGTTGIILKKREN